MHTYESLQAARHNIYSQCGEDGVLDAILATLKPRWPRWCVEFGAGDGKTFSNTRALIEAGWHSVQIEPHPGRSALLNATYRVSCKVTTIDKPVHWEGPNRLDCLLAVIPDVPRSFDVLSVDIDGNDWHVWRAVQQYRPTVVVVEYNPTFPPWIDHTQPADIGVNMGPSLAALCRLAAEKRYRPVCCTDWNLIVVAEEHAAPFAGIDPRPWALAAHNWVNWTALVQDYTGRVMVAGNTKRCWGPAGDLPVSAILTAANA